MINSKSIAFLFLSFFLTYSVAKAQEFNMAIGGRLGAPMGVTIKKFINETDAIDISGGLSWVGPGNSLGGLLQWQRHNPLDVFEDEPFTWWYGVAASASFWSRYGQSGMYIGGHGAFGVSYTFEDEPFNLSLELNPGIVVGRGGSYYSSVLFSYFAGVSGRYILN